MVWGRHSNKRQRQKKTWSVKGIHKVKKAGFLTMEVKCTGGRRCSITSNTKEVKPQGDSGALDLWGICAQDETWSASAGSKELKTPMISQDYPSYAVNDVPSLDVALELSGNISCALGSPHHHCLSIKNAFTLESLEPTVNTESMTVLIFQLASLCSLNEHTSPLPALSEVHAPLSDEQQRTAW